MKAKLLQRDRVVFPNGDLFEAVMWELPSPVEGSRHAFKYRLAYVVEGRCVVRFDNERGKGDHMHLGSGERPYIFTTPAALTEDFWREVKLWRR